MMEDANLQPSGSELEVDLCIVGAGPAGISLALQFLDSGKRVLLVESGGVKEEHSTQKLYEGEVTNEALHSPVHEYRHRVLGGSSLTWGGRCMPFDPIDFENRPWITPNGWPIAYESLEKYYARANTLCEAGDKIYSAQEAVKQGMRPVIEGFAPKDFSCDPIERFSCPTNFGARYGHRLLNSQNVRVLLNANATEIVKEAQHISKIILKTLSGKKFTVRAEHFVLATGGLETPRLLLANQIGNDHVGRNYMCHIAGTMGDLTFTVPESHVAHGYERSWDGVYCRRRIALLPEAQRRLGLGNAVFRLHHPRLADPAHRTGILSLIYLAKPFISYEYAKRLHGDEAIHVGTTLRHMLNVVRDPFGTAGFLMNWAWVRTLAARKFPSLIVRPKSNVYSLDIHGEQVPNPESRVTLGTQRDALDMRRLRVDWRYTPLDIRTISESLKLLQAEFAAWGGAVLKYDPEDVERCMLREGAYGGHHIGTVRMGRSPETGAVDTEARVFGTDNLYVASAAIFPTSSQANPTLTIVATALRLADHLKQQMEG